MAGRLKHKAEMYGQGGEVHTAWEKDRVLKEYDSLLSKQIADANAWRFVGIAAVIMIIVLSLCFMYLGLKPKREFMVIGVNDVGQVRYYGNVAGKSFEQFTDVEKVLKNNVKEFLEGRFTISTDSDVMYNNFRHCLYFLDSSRRQAFISEVNKEDPFSQVGRVKKNITVDTIIPLSKSSFQAEFYTTESELTGARKTVKRWRAIFTFVKINVDQYANLKEEEYLNNASGFYINDYNIEEVKIGVN